LNAIAIWRYKGISDYLEDLRMSKMPIAASTVKPSSPQDRNFHKDAAADHEPVPVAIDKQCGKYVLLRRTSMTDVARESTEES
jgi:hypothetical protein